MQCQLDKWHEIFFNRWGTWWGSNSQTDCYKHILKISMLSIVSFLPTSLPPSLPPSIYDRTAMVRYLLILSSEPMPAIDSSTHLICSLSSGRSRYASRPTSSRRSRPNDTYSTSQRSCCPRITEPWTRQKTLSKVRLSVCHDSEVVLLTSRANIFHQLQCGMQITTIEIHLLQTMRWTPQHWYFLSCVCTMQY